MPYKWTILGSPKILSVNIDFSESEEQLNYLRNLFHFKAPFFIERIFVEP